jgi:CheY-like chemotaxis protein
MREPQRKPQSQPPRVLVVEDEALVRAKISGKLRRLGMEVVEANSADEALSYLSGDSTIGLVFSDVRVPGSLDRLALAHQVRRRHPTLPIIVTSGNAAPHKADLFPSVPKPINCKILARAITDALSEAAKVYSRGVRTLIEVPIPTEVSENGGRQLDIERSAKILVSQHGAGAEEAARSRMKSLAGRGDIAQIATWCRILAAVRELQRPEPADSIPTP